MESQSFETTHLGKVIEISSDHGAITYYKDEEQNVWIIENIVSYKQGAGHELVSEFVKAIGAGQKVQGLINEHDSLDTLKELGSLQQVQDTRESLTIEEREILEQLKIVNVLKKGGVETEKVDLSYEEIPTREYNVGATFHGRT